MPDGRLDVRVAGRIVALLMSLAVLAERSAARSFPVRWLVLVLLRRAEAVALPLVADAGGIDPSCFGGPDTGFAPVDAMLLAMRLRTLAAALSAILLETVAANGGMQGDRAVSRGGFLILRSEPVAFPGAARLLFDTS